RTDDAAAPLVLTGIAIGLAIGTKASLLVPTATIWLAIVIGRLVRLPRGPVGREGPLRFDLRAAARAGVLSAIPAVAFGGFWYLKNIVVFGNPVWPFRLGPLPRVADLSTITQTPRGLVGLPEIVAILRSWIAEVGVTSYPYDPRVGGMGLAWSVLLVLAAIGLFRADRPLRPYVWVLLGSMVLTLVTMPMGWWPRLAL